MPKICKRVKIPTKVPEIIKKRRVGKKSSSFSKELHTKKARSKNKVVESKQSEILPDHPQKEASGQTEKIVENKKVINIKMKEIEKNLLYLKTTFFWKICFANKPIRLKNIRNKPKNCFGKSKIS